MKYIKQFCIILAISFLGEILHWLIPLQIPSSIYGLIILFIGLQTRLIPLASVRETGIFLIEIMPLMFIPAMVGLLDCWPDLQPVLLPIAAITAGQDGEFITDFENLYKNGAVAVSEDGKSVTFRILL